MGTADEDLKLEIDLRPDGVRLHRVAIEAHLPEVDGLVWAQIADQWKAAKTEAEREEAMRFGWGSTGARFYQALDRVDGIFRVGGQGRNSLKVRLDSLFREQRGGGAPLPAGDQRRPVNGYSKPKKV